MFATTDFPERSSARRRLRARAGVAVLGAAGAVSSLACILAIRDGVIPPTINLDTPDPECDLDYTPNVSKRREVKTALANGFGFRGQNASAVFTAVE